MTGERHETWATRTLTRGDRPVGRQLRQYRLRVEDPAGEVEHHHVTNALLRVGSQRGNDLVLSDPSVSRLHFEIIASDEGYRLRDRGSRNGTIVDGYRTSDIFLRPSSTVLVGKTKLVFEVSEEESSLPLWAGDSFGPAVGQSLVMRELFAHLEKASLSEATLLLEGESGTGKEVLAEAAHLASARSGGPLITVDCGAIPSNLLESELFGHERGAFTGADRMRVGQMEEANGGTLFLDEIGELPLDLQPVLLRALESRTIRRVGGTTQIPLDLRVVAATNRDLSAEVNRGAFRPDLYYRLAVVRLTVPPLRERREDIPLLVESFLRKAHRKDPAEATRLLSSISDANWKQLGEHPWPGNVRELRNVIERSLALGNEHGLEMTPDTQAPRRPSGNTQGLGVDLDSPYRDQKAEWQSRFDRAYLLGQLERHDGNVARAARAAGMERTHFRRALRKYKD